MSGVSDEVHESAKGVGGISLLRSEAILLAIIPFIGTFEVFVYEYSYLKYYDVPIGLMQLDVVKIVSASAAIFFLLLAFVFLIFYVRLIVQGEHPLQKALITPLVMCLILGAFLILGRFEYKWYILVGVFVVSYLFCLLDPLLDKNSKGERYLDRLRRKNNEPVNVEYKDKAFGAFAEYAALPLFLTFLIAMFGGYNAAEKTDYMKLVGENKVLVEVYGDIMVFKEFDPQAKRLGPEVALVKINEENPVRLERVNVGPLERHVVKGENPNG